jgi:hypothetical protein
MRDLVFAMELRGRAAPVEGKANTLRARTAGRGPRGETVSFESQVVLSGETFNETGSLEYSGHGKLRFETVGAGHIVPGPVAGLQWGAVIWRITAGEGEFRGATGYITSTFTVSADGDVVDNLFVRMFIP